MTTMCTSDTSLMAMLIHDLLSLTSFLTSHPIHFAYLLFFSPYLFSIFSFLSPLLISTLLSVIAVLTMSPYLANSSQLPLEFEFLGKTCSIALNVLCTLPGPRQGNTIGMLEELDEMVLSPIVQALVGNEVSGVEYEVIIGELYNSSTEVCEMESRDQEVLSIEGGISADKMSDIVNLASEMQRGNSKFSNSSGLVCGLEANNLEELSAESNCEEKRGNDLFFNNYNPAKDLPGHSCASSTENYKIMASLVDTGRSTGEPNGVGSEIEKKDQNNVNLESFIHGEEKLEQKSSKESLGCNSIEERLTKSMSINGRNHERTPSRGLEREGSIRVEKEWKRTLACKLYEDRMTFKLREERSMPVPVPVQVNEGEGEAEEMDLLWEAIEVSSNKSDGDKSSKRPKGKKEVARRDESEEEGEEVDEGPVRQLCCLQAFRVSTRKMNLGVGRPNLVKLSKVLKKISIFHIGRNTGKKEQREQILCD